MPSRIGAETAAKCAAAWPDVLARIAGGSTIAEAVAAHGLEPQHLFAFRTGDEQRRQAWEDARRASADSFADEALATARNADLDSAHARVLTDTLKWAAAKRNPDHYADRSRHDVNVKSLDLTPILERAEARLQLAQAAGRVVEGIVLGTETEVNALM